MAQNFHAWVGCIRECLDANGRDAWPDADLDALATFVLVIMEGGVMLSRSYKSVVPFDRAVEQLREYFRLLLKAQS